jgi:hypothetical protein
VGISFQEQEKEVPPIVLLVLSPLNMSLFVVVLLTMVISWLNRVLHALGRKRLDKVVSFLQGRKGPVHRGRLVQYKTGEPVVGAQVLVYGRDRKIKHKLRTNISGVFTLSLVPGDYTIAVKAKGFNLSPAAATFEPEQGEIVYTGGTLNIANKTKAVSLVIPMKPTGEVLALWQVSSLHLWQILQRQGHLLSWPIFIGGAFLNTALLLVAPGSDFLTLEIVYVGLVAAKIFLEVKMRPSYGLVRDAITHVPLDLAVVRLYEQNTNRLVMTRVADSRGRFFALPPPGRYVVTVTKPGYAPFARGGVEIKPGRDSEVQIKADLMPVAPQLAPAGARA